MLYLTHCVAHKNSALFPYNILCITQACSVMMAGYGGRTIAGARLGDALECVCSHSTSNFSLQASQLIWMLFSSDKFQICSFLICSIFDVSDLCQNLFAIVHPLPSLPKACFSSSIGTSPHQGDATKIAKKRYVHACRGSYQMLCCRHVVQCGPRWTKERRHGSPKIKLQNEPQCNI